MDRYFTEMRKVLVRHGGIVEKYIGDAIMAVFGLPRAHEDDALRAVRAATEMRAALEPLNIEIKRDWGVSLANRVGVNTGEVVIGDPSSGQRLATGDAINLAARLEERAPNNHILLGQATLRLVRDAVRVEGVKPLTLKGKSERIVAFSLIEVKSQAGGIPRRPDAALVGRAAELAHLLEAFRQAVKGRFCRLVTVLGEAGVGKTRLIAEAVSELRQDAVILTGRCLSYGEGITFWPLAEILRQAAFITEEDSSEEAKGKLEALFQGRAAPRIAERVLSVVGASSTSFPGEEISWAARELLQHLARLRPLVVVFEDIHWAEETFLDWIDEAVKLVEAPILFVCAARDEFLDERPHRSREKPNASIIGMDALSDAESEVLISNFLGLSGGSSEIGARIAGAAKGNPLFLEQIASMWIDDGTLRRHNGTWILTTDPTRVPIPPSLSALLSARLDRLPHDQRVVIAAASIVGDAFSQAAVEELCPTAIKGRVSPSIAALQIMRFVQDVPSLFAGEGGFAFHHVLIRDAAYNAMLKRTRAELHERYADWLERRVGTRLLEFEEIVAHHLEQASLYRRELRAHSPRDSDLSRRAGELLARVGRRAADRGDEPAARNLLERAIALLPQESLAMAEALIDLGDMQRLLGAADNARNTIAHGIAIAETVGNEAMRMKGMIRSSFIDEEERAENWTREARALADRAIPLFEGITDHEGSFWGWCLKGTAEWKLGHLAQEHAALKKSLRSAQCASYSYGEGWARVLLLRAMEDGPFSVESLLPEAQEVVEWARQRGARRVELSALGHVAMAQAMTGDFASALESLESMEYLATEVNRDWLTAEYQCTTSDVAMLEGRFHDAEIATWMAQDSCPDDPAISEVWARVAEALYAQGRYQEAEEPARKARATAGPSEIQEQARWRKVSAKLQTRRGDNGLLLVREAMDLLADTDAIRLKAEVSEDLAEVLHLTGAPSEASAALRAAMELHKHKGNIVSAAKARKVLKQLRLNEC